MQEIQLDASKLLGFRLTTTTAISAKVGNKPIDGSVIGAKTGAKPAAIAAKIGNKPIQTGAKVGLKPTSVIGAKVGAKPLIPGAKIGLKPVNIAR